MFSSADYNYATFWVLIAVVAFLGFAAFKDKNNIKPDDIQDYVLEEE